MVIAVSMAAMMAASAVPFFFAYGRDSRRPVATAAVVLIYVAVWALIGFTLDYMMGMMMMPSSLLIAAAAVAMAVVYALTPWGTASCIACSAGIMLALAVVGMSNPFVIVAAAAVTLLYKITPWPVPALSRRR
ncbi:MAG: hypothetical protein E6I96_11510 [Chloroflexi bacterium]|nr:MAG: hypothetical protein E6I96_11510 [Chloroflexota bacterium]